MKIITLIDRLTPLPPVNKKIPRIFGKILKCLLFPLRPPPSSLEVEGDAKDVLNR